MVCLLHTLIIVSKAGSSSIFRELIFDITEKAEAARKRVIQPLVNGGLDRPLVYCGDELALDGGTEALTACRGSQSPR